MPFEVISEDARPIGAAGGQELDGQPGGAQPARGIETGRKKKADVAGRQRRFCFELGGPKKRLQPERRRFLETGSFEGRPIGL